MIIKVGVIYKLKLVEDRPPLIISLWKANTVVVRCEYLITLGLIGSVSSINLFWTFCLTERTKSLIFPLFPVKLVDGDLKYEVVQNFYSKISGTVNYANTSYVSNQKFDVNFFYMLLPCMNYSYNFVNK